MRALAYTMLGSSQAMDDVLQEAYLKAYRAYGGFRGDSSFATWLGSIVYRACVDHGRARSRDRTVPMRSDALERVPDDHRGDAAVDSHLEVMAALGRLSPDHRAVIVLVDLEGFSMAEAAGILAVPQGTAASRLSRARTALQRALREPCDQPLAGGGAR